MGRPKNYVKKRNDTMPTNNGSRSNFAVPQTLDARMTRTIEEIHGIQPLDFSSVLAAGTAPHQRIVEVVTPIIPLSEVPIDSQNQGGTVQQKVQECNGDPCSRFKVMT